MDNFVMDNSAIVSQPSKRLFCLIVFLQVILVLSLLLQQQGSPIGGPQAKFGLWLFLFGRPSFLSKFVIIIVVHNRLKTPINQLQVI